MEKLKKVLRETEDLEYKVTQALYGVSILLTFTVVSQILQRL